jgi:hypothetical protein
MASQSQGDINSHEETATPSAIPLKEETASSVGQIVLIFSAPQTAKRKIYSQMR